MNIFLGEYNLNPKNSTLYKAVAKGDISAVKALTSGTPDINQFYWLETEGIATGEFLKFTPLTKAVRLGHREIVRVLLEAGVNLPEWKEELSGALDIASHYGNLEIMQLLEEHGAINYYSIHPEFDLKNRTLYEFVVKGDLSAVRKLVCDRPDVNQFYWQEWEESEYDSFSPLDKAVELGHVEIAKILLAAGCCFPYWKQKHISSALHLASGLGNLEMMRLLLQAGAKENRFLMSNSIMASQALVDAVLGRHTDAIQLLIEAGADVNTLSDWGTPLIVAAKEGDIELVKFLIEVGADANIISEEQASMGALSIAASNGDREVFDYLFPLVDDPEELEYARETLPKGIVARQRREDELLSKWFGAVADRNLEVIRELALAGIDVNCFCETGKTALHLAAGWGDIEEFIDAIEVLAELGANLDILDEDEGTTPLMGVIRRCAPISSIIERRVLIIQTLIRCGANVNARSRHGYTALFIAEQEPSMSPAIKQILYDAGATL